MKYIPKTFKKQKQKKKKKKKKIWSSIFFGITAQLITRT
jgi:hypothetical protein